MKNVTIALLRNRVWNARQETIYELFLRLTKNVVQHKINILHGKQTILSSNLQFFFLFQFVSRTTLYPFLRKFSLFFAFISLFKRLSKKSNKFSWLDTIKKKLHVIVYHTRNKWICELEWFVYTLCSRSEYINGGSVVFFFFINRQIFGSNLANRFGCFYGKQDSFISWITSSVIGCKFDSR